MRRGAGESRAATGDALSGLHKNKHDRRGNPNKTKTTSNLPSLPKPNKFINSISNNSNLQDDDEIVFEISRHIPSPTHRFDVSQIDCKTMGNLGV